jgi:hypothetical protein
MAIQVRWDITGIKGIKMSDDATRGSKTQTLSLRLDPKTKFIVDFLARVKGQSITTLVERAIKQVAAGTGVGPEWDDAGNKLTKSIWSDFWDPSDGVRTLNLLAEPYYPTTFEEDELRSFTLTHWQLFYTSSEGKQPLRANVEVLWPNIESYMQYWYATRAEDYWVTGAKMTNDLFEAGVEPPVWPPQTTPQSNVTDPND